MCLSHHRWTMFCVYWKYDKLIQGENIFLKMCAWCVCTQMCFPSSSLCRLEACSLSAALQWAQTWYDLNKRVREERAGASDEAIFFFLVAQVILFSNTPVFCRVQLMCLCTVNADICTRLWLSVVSISALAEVFGLNTSAWFLHCFCQIFQHVILQKTVSITDYNLNLT